MRADLSSPHFSLRGQRRKLNIPFGAQRFLAAYEGLEGGFAIGASVIIGLSFTGLDRNLLISTAIITIIVNGFNTASVKYSSEHYLDELDGREKRSAVKYYLVPALIEFIAYFAISLLTLLPFIFIHHTPTALVYICLATILILFGAGWWRAYMLHMPRLRDATETALLGVGIMLVGLVSGLIIYHG